MGVRTWMAACAAAMTCACAASADAGVVFSSLPDLNGAPTSDWNADYPVVMAGWFSLLAPESIGGVDVVMDPSTDPTYLSVAIFADDGGQLGQVFGNWGIGGWDISPYVTRSGTDVFKVNLTRITIPAGNYWLRITGYDTQVEGFTGSGPMLQCSDSFTDCTSTGQTMAFTILGDDPSTVTSSIPEPVAWAMVMLGVAMVGFAARRRNAGAPLAA